MLALIILMISPGLSAKGKGGVNLSGVVPIIGEVVIADNGSSLSVENKGSKDLKVKVQKRGPASVVTVSAP